MFPAKQGSPQPFPPNSRWTLDPAPPDPAGDPASQASAPPPAGDDPELSLGHCADKSPSTGTPQEGRQMAEGTEA